MESGDNLQHVAKHTVLVIYVFVKHEARRLGVSKGRQGMRQISLSIPNGDICALESLAGFCYKPAWETTAGCHRNPHCNPNRHPNRR